MTHYIRCRLYPPSSSNLVEPSAAPERGECFDNHVGWLDLSPCVCRLALYVDRLPFQVQRTLEHREGGGLRLAGAARRL